MSRGGRREGAGRKRNALTVKTREIAEAAVLDGTTPLEFMLTIVRDPEAPRSERLDMAKAAAPYVHPKLAAVEHSGPGKGPIQVTIAGDDANLL